MTMAIETQDIIVDLMQDLGYRVNKDGVCQGLSMMCVQAFFAEDLSTFKKRLACLSVPEDRERVVLYSRGRQQIVDKLAERDDDDVRSVITENDKFLSDIIAFLDGVQLYQSWVEHHNLFDRPVSQRPDELVSKLVGPDRLTQYQLGGLVKIKSIQNAYTDDELQQLLTQIASISLATGRLISITLSSNEHTVTLNFDPKKNCIYLFDVNELVVETKNMGAFPVSWLKNALSEIGHMTVLDMNMYMPTREIGLKETPFFLKTLDHALLAFDSHTVTAEKAHYVNTTGETLAHYAAYAGDLDLMESLIKQGADIQHKNQYGVAPVWIATDFGFPDIVEKLFSAGVDRHEVNQEGNTLAIQAAQYGQAGVLSLLIDQGVNLNQANHLGETPALLAAKYGYSQLMSILKAGGAHLEYENEHGGSPLMIAAQENQPEVIRALHQAGCNLHAVSQRDGANVVVKAIYSNSVDVLRVLAELGMDLTADTPFGSPLEMAKQYHKTECINFLQQYLERKKTLAQLSLFSPAPSRPTESAPTELPPTQRRKRPHE